jgi:hypothetical protein
MHNPLLFPKPRKPLDERAPLVAKQRNQCGSLAGKQIEEKLTCLDQAMRELDSDAVQRLVAELAVLSKNLEHEESVGRYLEKGRFGWSARQRLKKEYIDRYVLLRGGGSQERDAFVTHPATSEAGNPVKFTLGDVTEAHVRHQFVQKVYALLGVQLIVTAIIASFIMYLFSTFHIPPAVEMVLLIVPTVVIIAVVCTMCCAPDLMKQYPLNYILLGILTIAMGVTTGIAASQYTAESVIIVAGITAFVVLGLSLFACQTSIDFTGFGPYLFVALLVLMAFGFVLMFANVFGAAGPAWSTLRLIYSACGALLFSVYIVYDTQLILGGKHKEQFEVDDYCFATLSLYMDIINLFMFLLELFGDRKV